MTEHADAPVRAVAQWKQELPELAAENMLLIGRLKRAAAVIARELEKVYGEYGLTEGSFDVLATLRRSGAPYTLTPTELFSALMVTSGTMTTRLKNLENQGLIDRLPNPDDARSMLVRLTDKGKELIEQAVFPHVENEKRLMEKLDLKTKTSLEHGLEKWLEVLEGSR
ncbi:MarR family winged helix-turn-helix transcriptional regulator [Neisseria sp. Marseille-Q2251]|uniref:MarR family winged helix-turn-helix transcriptional regulator n=1 Tax=Neisseria sp. Marseille-Q2251 TaxID=2866585 RepID=UPI00313A0F9C